MKPASIRLALGAAAAAILLIAGILIGRNSGSPSQHPAPTTPAAAPASASSVPPALPHTPPAAPQPAAAPKSAPKPAPDGPADTALAAADALRAAGKPAEARAAYQALVAAHPETPAAAQAQDLLNATALEDYFRSLNDTNSAVYQVKPGDNLTRIAKEFGVMPGLVQAANFLKSDRIFPGQKLRVPKARWSLLVDKSQNTLYLKAADAVVRSYRVATGKDRSTPEGTFKILNHLKNPTWYYEGKVVPPDSPDNPLGTRWMGFDKEGYGLHGTTKPEEIGQFATLGCVRMLNADIEVLFDLLPPGTEVTIID